MHLNSSCSYAGVANMLELKGYDTEDYKIAYETDIGNHIRYDEENNAFSSGFSLQNKQWFDLYLNPRGFEYFEKIIDKNELSEYLDSGMMIGLIWENGQKHAVICTKKENGKFEFLNNKRENSDEPDFIYYDEDKLLNFVSEKVALGYIDKCKIRKIDLKELYLTGFNTWLKYKTALIDFMYSEQSAEKIKATMNSLFRPLLLDGVTMAELYKEEKLYNNLSLLQKQYIDVLKTGKNVKLSDCMDMNLMMESIDYIINRVNRNIKRSS